MVDQVYSNPNALVRTQWAMEHLNDPKVRIVEVGYGLACFLWHASL